MINDLLLVNSGFPVNFDGDRENIEPDLRGTIYALASENGDEDTFNKLLKMYPIIRRT